MNGIASHLFVRSVGYWSVFLIVGIRMASIGHVSPRFSHPICYFARVILGDQLSAELHQHVTMLKEVFHGPVCYVQKFIMQGARGTGCNNKFYYIPAASQYVHRNYACFYSWMKFGKLAPDF